MEFWHPSRHPSSRHSGAVESLVGFQNSRFEQTGLKISTHVTGESPVTWGVTLSPTWFEWRKVLIRRDWNPSIKNAEKKVLFGSNVVFQKGAKWSKYRFFMLLLLRILVGNIFYMLSDSNLLKNILIRQISSHRCRPKLLSQSEMLNRWKIRNWQIAATINWTIVEIVTRSDITIRRSEGRASLWQRQMHCRMILA